MRLVTFDTESDGFLEDATVLWCASAHIHGDDIGGTLHWRFDDDSPRQRDLFLNELEKADVLLGHNLIGHDLPLLKKLWGWEPKPTQKIVDTLLMSRMQNPDRRMPPHCPNKRAGPNSVEAWGYRLGHNKVAHDEWDRFSPEMLTRCIEDVNIQVKIYEALLKEGVGKGWMPCHKLNMKLFYWLQKQEEAGVEVDQDHMGRCLNTLDRWIDRIDRVVSPRLPIVVSIEEGKIKGEYGYVKKPFKKDGSYSRVTERFLTAYGTNPSIGYCVGDVSVGGPFSRISFKYTDLDSNMEVKDFLLKSGWIPDQWNTNNAGKRTSPKLSVNDSFHGISNGLGKLVSKRVQCIQRRGVIEGWFENIREDGRISAQIAGLAVTGRARHRQVVNVPGPTAFFGKQMRKIFVASPGKVLVGIDSVGNQVRQLAGRMDDEEFKKVVLDPSIDIHQYNADRAGIPIRHHAKTFYFALIFGAGNAKIARQLGIKLSKAKELRNLFFGGLPKLQPLLDSLVKEWKRNGGYIRGIDGRLIKVPGPHQLLVYLLQSDEAIQMSWAYVLFHERAVNRWSYDEDFRTVLWMHDEFQVECLPEIAEDIGSLAADCIRDAGEILEMNIPHVGDYKVGRNWFETH